MALDQLHATLQALLAAIDNCEGEAIAAHLQRLDELDHALGEKVPAELRHFLAKRSYVKALDFLEGRDEAAVPNG